jgi:hypothetical protein
MFQEEGGTRTFESTKNEQRNHILENSVAPKVKALRKDCC